MDEPSSMKKDVCDDMSSQVDYNRKEQELTEQLKTKDKQLQNLLKEMARIKGEQSEQLQMTDREVLSLESD